MFHHRVYSVIDISLQEIRLSQNYALNNLSCNLTELIMNVNKVIPAKSVSFEKFIPISRHCHISKARRKSELEIRKASSQV